jgi:predicted MFS family arabinose efflux permease
MYLNLQLTWTGCSIAFWSSILIPILVMQQDNFKDRDDVNKESKALFAMISFGFGEVIGGIIHGKVIDRWGSKNASIINVFICISMILMTLISLILNQYNWISFFMCFLWGY